MPPVPHTDRTHVLIDLGWPVRGRRGYHGLATVVCASREAARIVARVYEALGTRTDPSA